MDATDDQIEAARTKVRNMLHAADHGNHLGEVAVMRMAASEETLAVLIGACSWIDAAPHGDNCFLHSDGGEFDRCFCGKDSVSEYVNAAISKAEGSTLMERRV